MEQTGEVNNKHQVLLAEHTPASVASFTELFGRSGIQVIHANSGLDARNFSERDEICACIIVDDLEDVSGLELVREIHREHSDIPIVLIADNRSRRIPLEEVSVGWSGCYILKDGEGNYIQSAAKWINSSLQDRRRNNGSADRNSDSSEHRELLHSQRLESVGMLASGIAHDFNNILMAILGNASIAKDKVGKEHEAFRFVNIIEQCAERASALSNSLMRYARGEKSDLVPIFLPDLVDELLNIISTGLPGHVMIEKDFEDVHPVEGDSTKLQQVIMNLCLNAGDAMNERKLRNNGRDYVGTLSISIQPATLSQEQITEHHIEPASLERGFIRMRFSDNGSGMSANTLDNLFQPFFTTKKSGRGLGLSSVRGIIEELGGFITVDSELEVGTTFNVYLPCCDMQIDDEQSLLEVFSDSSVLVIDSDEEMRRLIGLSLQHMDYQVLLVESLDEALGVFLEHHQRISLVMFGVNEESRYPQQDIESLRRVDEDTPIVILSETDRENLPQLFGEGLATGYIQQPFKPDVLVRTIREIIRKRGID